VSIPERLESYGWTDGYEAFEEALCDTFTAMFPSWTGERLTLNWRKLRDFCRAVREKTALVTASQRLEEMEEDIVRVLVNNRKNRDNRLRVADREPDLFEDVAP